MSPLRKDGIWIVVCMTPLTLPYNQGTELFGRRMIDFVEEKYTRRVYRAVGQQFTSSSRLELPQLYTHPSPKRAIWMSNHFAQLCCFFPVQFRFYNKICQETRRLFSTLISTALFAFNLFFTWGVFKSFFGR